MWPWRPLSVRTRLTLWYTGILLGILVVVSALSYSLLRWSLFQDLDTSLLTVAQVIEDTGFAGAETFGARSESELQDILGPEFYDKFLQLVDPEGRAAVRSRHLRDRDLPLTSVARANAVHGQRTFETLVLPGREQVRVLTMPIRGNGPPQIVQVGISLQRVERALARYLQTLLVLIPLGLGLAAAGGALIARVALSPVDTMSRTALRITGEDLSQRLPLRGTGDELDHLAGTLNAMLARVEGSFLQMRRFAADAAHELRTPLTALKGGIEVALRAERPVNEYRRVLTSSLEEVDRLVRLAEDLLLLSRLASDGRPPRARVDLEPILADVFELGVVLGQPRGVSVRLRDSAPVAVLGDAAAIRRAFRNLVENAVKYTPAGGKVELALERRDGDADLVVSDTGVGMQPEDHERIFEPFVRLDAARARDTGGAGLGLAIARSIVVSHGGTLTVESAPGAGSTFTISLPLA
jgi:heavy metal sensor kinase